MFYAGQRRDRALSFGDDLLSRQPCDRRALALGRDGADRRRSALSLVTVTADPAEGEGFTESAANLVEPVPMPEPSRRSLRRSSPSTMSSGSSSSASATARTPSRWRAAAMEITTNERRRPLSAALVAPQARGANAEQTEKKEGSLSAQAWRPVARAAPNSTSRPCRRSNRSTRLTDVTAFLQQGVPAELTRAALRRVWTADPAIRDFVGLAENAWDFTDPAAMPGFGPLEATDEVRRMVAQVIRQIGQAAQPDDGGFAEESRKSNSSVINTTDRRRPIAPSVKNKTAQILSNQVMLQMQY